LRDGPRRFPQDFPCPVVLRIPGPLLAAFVYGTFTPYGAAFQPASTSFRRLAPGPSTPPPPEGDNGLGSFPFARRYSGNRFFFLFLQVLRWFTSLSSLPEPMDSVRDDHGFPWPGSPIRTSPDHRSLTAPRGFSQLATSFFASLRQGIHRMPLVA
jgi:hypothetical protein